MKKITFILFFTIVGLLTIHAQKNNTVFDKNNTEVSSLSKDNLSENANPKFNVSGKTLFISNMENGTILEIYNALGTKVQRLTYTGNPISLNSLNKGVYIIKTGKLTQKIML